jgi:hypothetical protein
VSGQRSVSATIDSENMAKRGGNSTMVGPATDCGVGAAVSATQSAEICKKTGKRHQSIEGTSQQK